MAVYTPVSETQMKAFLSAYDLGTLRFFSGIEQGVSNTNYHVTTTKGRYILTLFEAHRVREKDIPAFLAYASHLEAGGVICPHTLERKDGTTLSPLCDLPAALFSYLEGEGQTPGSLTPKKCYEAGLTLAKMHLAAAAMKTMPPNHFGIERWERWLTLIGIKMDSIEPGLFDLVSGELATLKAAWPKDLPAGAIHADFFPDNVFFIGETVSGVIDFHFVCKDTFVYDLAIAANAWAFDDKNDFVLERLQSLLAGYQSVRPLSKEESVALPLLLRAAALRFLLSRIEEKMKWKSGDFMIPHDPLVFAKRLKHWSQVEMGHVQG
jgi:homoserine kinase type II